MKYFRMSYEEVVFKRSYLNLILLNRAIPGYKPVEDNSKKNNKTNEDNDEEIQGEQHANDFFMKFM